MGDYRPPPLSMADETTDMIELPGEKGRWLFQRVRIYKGRVVDFCVELQLEDEDGNHFPIERVDCHHGEIHRHHFPKSGDERADKLLDLYVGMRDQVTAEYLRAYDDIVDDFEAKVGRWKNG
jgi:hypothetical protein